MAIVKKNIWFLFYIILFSGFIGFGVLTYFLWQDTYDDFQVENENIVKIVSNSTKTYFSQLDMLLKILGEQLSKEERYTDAVVSKKIFQDLIKIDKSIAGFGLVAPDGHYLMFSGDMRQIEMLPNLLEQKESKDSFKDALQSNNMVLGRTYFFPPLNSLVIPARKAIKDTTGKVLAVMTVGINVNKISFLNSDILYSDDNVIQLYREKDLYRQVMISKRFDTSKLWLYDKPFDSKSLERLMKYMNKKYGFSENEIKGKKFVFSYELVPEYEQKNNSDKRYLTSINYVDTYNLWAVSQIPTKNIKDKFLLIFGLYLVIFIAIFGVLYFLFRYINNFEESKKESLIFQATHDSLTQLPNRQYLMSMLDPWLMQNEEFSVMFVDLDNFKNTNDIYGHDMGDLVLKNVASRLKNVNKLGDLVIRHGGDEFLLLTKVKDDEQLKQYAKKIIKELSMPFKVQDVTILLGASIGISVSNRDGVNINELISCADVALYEAKKNKNSYCIFKKKLKNLLQDKIEIENQMKMALAQKEFYMCYQPQINADGSLYGVEALVRWENKKLGFIPPDKFIPLAESNGFIGVLGNFILDTVLKEINDIFQRSNIEFQISINISVKQFMEADFFENVTEKISENNIDPQKVTLEITEGLYIHDLEYIIDLLNKFRKVGVKISMDDFGTGYSSLSTLNKLPIDELKIDKQFVDNMLKDHSSFKMIQSIMNIGNAFNFHLLAEGIERQEQAELLKKFDCKTYQGYYYSKPVKKDELEKYVLNILLK